MRKGAIIRVLEGVELFLYRRAALIVSVTESFRADLRNRGVDPGKIVVVRNGVDLDGYRPQPKSEDMVSKLGLAGKFVIAYLGTHGMAHALENVLEAAMLLRDDDNIRFLLVGDGARKANLEMQAKKMALNNVVMRDSMPKSEMPGLWSVCDVALVHLKDDPVFSTVIPSKIFEAFGMGKPVLIVQPGGEATKMVLDAGAGEHVPPEDPEALARAVKRLSTQKELLSEYASNSLAAASLHCRDKLASDMLAALDHVKKLSMSVGNPAAM